MEIENYTYPDTVYEFREPIPFTSPNDSNPVFVDTEEGVREMLEELKAAKEIAIDLEHNDQRSYIGLVCLMQISTREKDWIIDTLKPWRENLRILNEVFADPKILKVFHGSNMDMIWLQRDLGLYVVGLFDTYHACCALQMPGKGLKHLLQRFANFEAQKQFQLADWRVRPLPAELVDYARSDTHYLLNIYDHLRNILIEESTRNVNLIDFVLMHSKQEALQVYERPVYDLENGLGPQGWYSLLTTRAVKFDKEQLGVFKAVHAWRDRKARELDEGVGYILPARLLWIIAESMPTSAFNFHACSKGHVPKPVTDNLPELLEVVKKGKFEGRGGKSVQEVMQHNQETYGIVPRKQWKERKEVGTTYEGLGATLKQLAASGNVGSPVTLNYDGAMELPIASRCSASLLWGDVAPQHSQLPPEVIAALDALTSVLPLPPAATEEVKGDHRTKAPTELQTSTKSIKAPNLSEQTPSATKNNAIFILSDLSRSKKRKMEETDTEHAIDIPKMYASQTKTNPAVAAPAKDRRLYIGKLNDATSEADIMYFFSGYDVESTELVNGNLGKYAFVDLRTSGEAARAIKHLSGRVILGCNVSVELASEAGETDEAASESEGISGVSNRSEMYLPVNGSAANTNSPLSTQHLDPEYEAQRALKKQKKAEKKARKEAEAAARAISTATAQPFDYTSAESLLHPQNDEAAQESRQVRKRMNPFAKALDTGTGARRGKMGKELAGKSMTFKT